MQAVHHVHFGERLVGARPQAVENLLDGGRVRARHAFLQAGERTEEARGLADVRGLEPQVVIEEGLRAVAPLALAGGEPADGQQIGRLEQAHALVEREALARLDLVGDVG